MPHFEITEVVLVHCNNVNHDYQEDWRVLYAFISNKSFGQLLDISLTSFILLIQNFHAWMKFINW